MLYGDPRRRVAARPAHGAVGRVSEPPAGPEPVPLHAADGGLRADSVALAEQVRAISKTRLTDRWGTLAAGALRRLEWALAIALNLPGQFD